MISAFGAAVRSSPSARSRLAPTRARAFATQAGSGLAKHGVVSFAPRSSVIGLTWLRCSPMKAQGGSFLRSGVRVVQRQPADCMPGTGGEIGRRRLARTAEVHRPGRVLDGSQLRGEIIHVSGIERGGIDTSGRCLRVELRLLVTERQR